MTNANDNDGALDPRDVIMKINGQPGPSGAETGDAEPHQADDAADAGKQSGTDTADSPTDTAAKAAAKRKKAPAERTLAEAIKVQAREEELPQSKTFTLGKILGGDMLSASMIRKQIWVLVLITVFIVLYITNRYSCQQYLIEIDALNVELKDVKYRAMSSGSMLTEMSRESRVLEKLKENQDSALHISKQPPFIINVPQE